MGGVKGVFDKEPRNRPEKVRHPFDLPNHPVVGITWYEALAFSRWLTERWQAVGLLSDSWVIRLPTEAEWEKGARGSGQVPETALVKPVAAVAGLLSGVGLEVSLRDNGHSQAAYIWGSQPDPNRGNCEESGIKSSSAVGCFPGGVSPYGVEEIAGNVWEWTGSLFGQWDSQSGSHKHIFGYPYRLDDDREDLTKGTDWSRVVRGGSYYNESRYMRCSFRGRDLPDYPSWYYGFRVCLSPFLS